MFCMVECCIFLFFFKQKTAYEMRISDWSSDVCSSDLHLAYWVFRLRKIHAAEPDRRPYPPYGGRAAVRGKRDHRPRTGPGRGISEPQPASLADLPPERVPGGRTRFRGQRDGRRIERKDGFRLEPGWPAPRHAQDSEGNIGRQARK